MRRFLLPLLLLLALPLSAHRQQVRSIDVRLSLDSLGTVSVHEKWDLNTGDDITEWYLVRTNLGDISIEDFSVLDEDGRTFLNEGSWDVDRSREAKAGRCGMVVRPDGGRELCWGVAPLGNHVFHVFYKMTNAVKSLQDYDMLHLQAVSPGLSTPPQKVRVTVEAPGIQIDTTNTRLWGFGYTGRTAFQDGKAVFSSTEPFRKDDSVIVLLRFDKGLFHSPSVQDRPFQDALDIAMAGADFGDKPLVNQEDEEADWADIIAKFATLLLFYFAFLRPFIRMFTGKKSKKEIRRVLGVSKPSAVPWSRDIPMEGNLLAADRVLLAVTPKRRDNCLALAEILRMVHQGYLKPSRALEGPLHLSLSDKSPEGLEPSARQLYDMLQEAAGEDRVLDDKEFSAWAGRHSREVYDWSHSNGIRAATFLDQKGWYTRGRYSEEGKRQTRAVVGLKNFLSDFTLVKERETFEAGLWKEYLVYAALYGIADKVAAQLKDLDPTFFHEFPYEVSALPSLLEIGEVFARSVQKAVVQGSPVSYSSSSGSSGGYGGSSSHGGGGGFSGGGYGGGGR